MEGTAPRRPVEVRTAALLDAHPLWLEGVAQLLERKGFTVVGKARTPEEALAVVESHRPDVLISEAALTAGTDGLDTIAHARRLHPDLKAVVLSAHADPSFVDAAFVAGAVAYVVKTAHPEDIAAAIRQAFDHSIFISRPARVDSPPAEQAKHLSLLTNRELEILQLVAEGYSNAQLARRLWVTEQTVKFHLSNIYRKLGVSNRTEASRWAQVNGLLPAGAAASVA